MRNKNDKKVTLPPSFVDAVMERDHAAVSRWIVMEHRFVLETDHDDRALHLMLLIQQGMYAEVEEYGEEEDE